MHSCADFAEEEAALGLPVIESITEEEGIKDEIKDEVEERIVVEVPVIPKPDKLPSYSSFASDPHIKTQSVEQSCRVCLCDLVEINHVGFRDSLKNFDGVTYLDVFKQCTGFDVSHVEPQHVCVDCAIRLVQAYELREQCVETQKVLDQLLSEGPDVKDEEEEMIIEELIEEAPEIVQESEELTEIQVYEEVMEEEIRVETPPTRKKVKKSVNPDCQEVQCETCLSNYKSIRALRNHYKASHAELKVHQCQYCHRQFFPQLVDIHMSHCSQRHQTIRQLCPVCGEAASRNHIYRHIARSKAVDETGRIIDKPYQCDICGARATTKNGIGIHIKALHLQLKIQCNFCEVQVKSRSILGTHMRRYHPEIKKPLKCEFCEFQTASAASLIRHRATHFGSRPHKCDFCERRFVTKDAWRVHTATHSDERPHKCEVCESPFKTRKALGAHMKTHKPHEYDCPVCKKSFLTNQQMRIHVTRIHPNFVLPPAGTILNKSWHAKRTEFEMKRDGARRMGLDEECIEAIEIEQNSNREEEIFY